MTGRHASFTGSHVLVTDAQVRALEVLLVQRAVGYLHHGDCVEGDAKADAAAKRLGVQPIVHPPLNSSHRAFCMTPPALLRPARGYLERDRDLVDEGGELFACPREDAEPPRSRAGGTWYTVRYARRTGHTVYVIWPSGAVDIQPPDELGSQR